MQLELRDESGRSQRVQLHSQVPARVARMRRSASAGHGQAKQQGADMQFSSVGHGPDAGTTPALRQFLPANAN